jgi:integrase
MMPDQPLPFWPRYLSREQAAQYVGVSSDTFDREVLAGMWPPPRRRGARLTRLTWDRCALDAAADRDSGLGGQPAPAQAGIWGERSNGKAKRINVSVKHLPDGTVRRYYYDQVTGTPLGSDREKAEQRATRQVSPHARSFATLIARYLGRPEFTAKLAPKTQKLYRGYLEEMRIRYGYLLIDHFDAGAIEDIKAAFQTQPRKANQILALFRILLGYAVRLRLLRDNPALRPEMLPTPPRTQIWSYAEEDAFVAAARPSLCLAISLLIYTAQRPSDVLAMTKAHIAERDGRLWTALRQAKTGELLDLPVHARLVPMLRERMEQTDNSLLLVPSPAGLPWAYRNFARAWDQTKQEAKVNDRQRRDLRRTGVVRLAEAGATVPQIAAVTGWGIDYCQRIVDVYLPRRPEVAAAAIEIWEKAPGTDSRVVTLGLHRKRR